jgi:tetraacyldisaccharide 4'-kinase
VLAALARLGLGLLAVPYRLVVALRNRLYGWGLKRTHRASCPVVCVGNITAGGTGKTPMVEWIADQLVRRGRKPAILSRGYGARRGPNDEALLLAERLPDVPHLQHPDRVMSARAAVAQHGADFLLLDDGFQHRRLARDVDVVLLDATNPFGFGHLLPRGLLREPVSALRRADMILLTRCGLVTDDALHRLRARVESLAPEVAVGEVVEEPFSVVALHTGDEAPVASIGGVSAMAFCGIGNPAAFFRLLESLGVRLVATRVFPDHYGYGVADLEAVADAARAAGASCLLTTHKDAVKLAALPPATLPVRVLHIRARIRRGEQALGYLLGELIAETSPPEDAP